MRIKTDSEMRKRHRPEGFCKGCVQATQVTNGHGGSVRLPDRFKLRHVLKNELGETVCERPDMQYILVKIGCTSSVGFILPGLRTARGKGLAEMELFLIFVLTKHQRHACTFKIVTANLFSVRFSLGTLAFLSVMGYPFPYNTGPRCY